MDRTLLPHGAAALRYRLLRHVPLLVWLASLAIAGTLFAAERTLVVSEQPIALQVGQTRPVKVTVTPALGAGETLRYESGNAGFFTVDDKGTLKGIHQGDSSLAIIAPDGARTEVPVTVTPAADSQSNAQPAPQAPAAAPLEGILAANADGELLVGDIERIIAHVLPYNVIGANPFTIASSDPSVLEAVDAAKVVRALKPGSATVTVTTLDGKFADSIAFTVVAPPVQDHPADKTYTIEPERFGIRYDDASEAVAKANSAGLYAALKHTADSGRTRLLMEPGKVLYIEPKETIHLVSNVQWDLNGSEIRLRPNDYERYTAIEFAEKDRKRVLENASIVNGTLTGERDEKEKYLPNWSKNPKTEGACTLVFGEGPNNGIRNLTVRKSIGFNISSRLGSDSAGVVRFSQNTISARNMEPGGFDDQGRPIDAKGLIRTVKPLDISKLQTPYYTIGLPLGYMGYPYANSRIYDVCFFDKEMKPLSAKRGQLRYRQYELPAGSAFVHLALYQDKVPTNAIGDFGDALAFVENRAMPVRNYMIGCTIEDNYSCGWAACGGQQWLIKDNVFRRNGGRMPGCDIDWEDGWEYMQGDLIVGNRFESRINVITCAGIGLVFAENTFRGESVFYGRSQGYSLLGNVFERSDGEPAQQVKLSLSSQSDIYCYGDRFKNASVGYTRQHNKAPYIGTYEATFTDVTFDATNILGGDIARLVNCTIVNPPEHAPISADLIDGCTFAAGSYTAGGVIRGARIHSASFRVRPGTLLTLRDSDLVNPTFAASVAAPGLLLEECRISVDQGDFLVTPNNMQAVTIRNCAIRIAGSANNYALVGGWNATGANAVVTFDSVRFTLPPGFKGYLHKFAWYPPANDSNRITYAFRNTNVSAFQRTDERGARSNAVFDLASR